MKNNEAGLACEEGDDKMFLVSGDDIREESVMGSEDAKDSESLTDTLTINEKDEIINDDTNTTKEVLLVPKKKVVKKRKLVKGKVTVAKDEEKPQSSEMHDPSVEVRTNQNVKNEENVEELGNQEKETLNVEVDKEKFIASVDMQNNEAGLASKEGDDEMFIISDDDIKEESVMGSEDAKDLESVTDAVNINEKEEIINADTNTTKEVLLVPKKKVLKRKKVVKKRKLVKGKVAIAKDEEKPQSSEMPDPSVEVRTNQNVKNEENPDGKKSKQSEKNKQDGKGKMEAKSESRAKSSKINSRKAEMGTLGEVTAEDKDEAEPSEKHKSSNKLETTGMIFMCSSKTKEDCYRYKILGLPASKKDVVLKVDEGMRLFLFDFQLKLLYGIYKAAGPGGYNIEPNAFKSNFPSQVRFTIVHECSPLPEEKFKKVIKENYYTKNKFNCELNSNQVKSLCKLFLAANKGSKSKAKAVTERPKVGIRPTVEREKKGRVRVENDDQSRKRRAIVDSERDSKRRRVVDDVKRSRATGNARPLRARGDVSRPRAKGDVRPPRAKGDVRRSRVEDYTRRTRLEDDARRSRAQDEARRLRFEDDARRDASFLRVGDEERRLRLEVEERRLWIEDEEMRLRIEDEERRLRIEGEERRLRLEDEERRLRAEDDSRRLWDEDDARRVRADDRRHSPLTLNGRYPRHADVYEREAYLPSALPTLLHLDAALPPPSLPTYTSSYTGRTSLLNDYRLDTAIENEDRGLAYSRPQSLYEYETRDPYLPYREPIVHRDPGYDVSTGRSYYSPLASRDEYLPSSSRTSRYRFLPSRRY